MLTLWPLFLGRVEISPSEVALVCQVGDQVELTCTTSGTFLRWELFNDASLTRQVSSAGAAASFQPWIINSTTVAFSRVSAPGVLPLKSTVTISPVTASLNGSVVTCVDLETSNTSSTTIYVMDSTVLLPVTYIDTVTVKWATYIITITFKLSIIILCMLILVTA